MFTHIATRFCFDFLFTKKQQEKQRNFSSLQWKTAQQMGRRTTFANGTHRTQMKKPIKIAKFLLMVYAELCAAPK